MRQKPVLLLDVDGVLNVVGPDYGDRLVRMGNGHPFHPTEHVLPFMEWAWATFRVVWCTAWRQTANNIADWAGLPHAPAIVETTKFKTKERRFHKLIQRDKRSSVPALTWYKDMPDWKLEGAKEFLGSSRRTVFWIEDGIGPVAQEWVHERPRTYYFATDSFEGVTPAHMDLMKNVLRGGGA